MEHVKNLLSEYIDGALTAADRTRVEAHLAACPDCRRELAEIKAVSKMIADLPQKSLPAGFMKRLNERRRAESESTAIFSLPQWSSVPWARPVAVAFCAIAVMVVVFQQVGRHLATENLSRLATGAAGTMESAGQLAAPANAPVPEPWSENGSRRNLTEKESRLSAKVASGEAKTAPAAPGEHMRPVPQAGSTTFPAASSAAVPMVYPQNEVGLKKDEHQAYDQAQSPQALGGAATGAAAPLVHRKAAMRDRKSLDNLVASQLKQQQATASGAKSTRTQTNFVAYNERQLTALKSIYRMNPPTSDDLRLQAPAAPASDVAGAESKTAAAEPTPNFSQEMVILACTQDPAKSVVITDVKTQSDKILVLYRTIGNKIANVPSCSYRTIPTSTLPVVFQTQP